MQNNSLLFKSHHAWVMFCIGVLVSFFAGHQVKLEIEQEAARQFEITSDQVSLKIQDRLDAYALILQGGAGLFAGSNSVDRAAWRAYVKKLHAHDSVPGVQGIGFSRLIPPHQLAAHVAGIRAEGFPDYTVRPAGERSVYTSIVYLEPFQDRNLRAFGFDMFSEPVRRNAMERARDSGKAALSGKVELVQETGNEVQAGTLMYVPVYRNGEPVDTVDQRRSALIGWTYSPYRMQDLMGGILENWTSNEGKVVDLHVYDGLEANTSSLLFDSTPPNSPRSDSLFYQQRAIKFHDHQWLLVFDAIEGRTTIHYAAAWATLIGCLGVSGLLLGLMLSVINTRANAKLIANTLTEEIRTRETLLKDSDAFKLAILNSVSAEIVVLDSEGVILAVNEQWRRFALENGIETGKPVPHTDIGDNYFAACRTGTGPASKDAALIANKGIREVLGGIVPNFTMEYPCHSPDQQRWFSMSVTSLKSNHPSVVVAHTNITEQKRTEATLVQSEERLRAVVEGTTDAVYLKDVNGRYLLANSATARFIGKAAKEILGHDDTSLFPSEDARTIMDTDRRIMDSDNVTVCEECVTTADGCLTNFLSTKGPIHDSKGTVVGLFGVARDITERKLAEKRISELNRDFVAFLENTSDFIYFKDENSRFRFCSQTLANITGHVSWRDMIGKHDLEVFPKDTAQIYFEEELPIFLKGTPLLEKVDPYYDAAGNTGWVSTNKWPLFDNDKKVVGLFGISRDITEHKRAEEKLQLAASVFAHAREGIMITDLQGMIIEVNDAFSRITGYDSDEVVGRNPRILSSGLQEKSYYSAMWSDLISKGHWYGEVWNRRKNGEVYAEMQNISTVYDSQGNPTNFVALFSDITVIKKHQSQLEHIAHYDALTRLPNRQLFADRLQQAMAQAERREQPLAVVFLDLDGFKAINDSHGHEAGDKLLITIASRMKEAIREGDTLARFGGDEFVAILTDLLDVTSSETTLLRLLDAAAQPVNLGDLVLKVSASIGVTFYPQAVTVDSKELLRQADAAMYQAKESGKNRYSIFNAG